MSVRRNAHDVADRILSALALTMFIDEMEITYHDDDTGSITLIDDEGTEFIVRIEMIHEAPISREIPNV